MESKQTRRVAARGWAGVQAWLPLLLLLLPAVAAAQTPGTDCACTLTGAFVEPDPGVRPATGAVSPGGAFRVEGGALPGPVTVVRQSDDVAVLQAQAGSWGWSPDGERVVIALVSGTPPNQLHEYWLYDLSQGPTSTPIWQAASTLWGSTRLRFSEGGAVFLFAGVIFNSQVQLEVLELASAASYATTFSFYNPPAQLDDDVDPTVAGWGFGPDPTRFAYAYATGQDTFTRVIANVRTGAHRGLASTAVADVVAFSPCGDVFGAKVQQQAVSGEVSVSLYSTLDPPAPMLGSQGFPNGLATEMRANAADHVGLLGGIETPIASNTAGDACAVANQPPQASFDAPSDAIAGQAAVFTDTSSDSDGTIVSWLWDFGDSLTSSAPDPSHTFAAAGRYLVRLTVTDEDGDSDSFETTVVVCGDLASAAGQLLYSESAGLYGDGFNRDLFAFDVSSLATVQLSDSDWCQTPGTCFAQFGGSGTTHGARSSPDATAIAFAPAAWGENGIWVMDADGRNRRRLTDGSLSGDFDTHRQPAWSPDGEWIVFEDWDFTDGSAASGLYMIRADGSGLVKIAGTLNSAAQKSLSPDFLPGLTPTCAALPPAQRTPACYRIAYVRRVDGIPPADTIWSVRGDGSEAAVLLGNVDIYHAVRVSPDGGRLAVERERIVAGTGDRGVYVFDLSQPGAVLERLSAEDLWAQFPVWSPDGQSIAYQARVVNATPVEHDVYVSDSLGCVGGVLRGEVGVDERPHDWKPGQVVPGPVSLSGQVVFGDGSVLPDYGGIVIALSGDAAVTVAPDADGRFVFDGLPAGGAFFVSVLAAPGYLFDPTPIPVELGGSAVGLRVLMEPDIATISGTLRLFGDSLADVTIRADGPGGPFEATTDALGHFVLTTRRDQTYTLSSATPGYRLDPVTSDVWVGISADIDLEAVVVPVLPPGSVAFTSDRDGDEEIYLLDLVSGVQTNLTNEPFVNDRDPAWSPDGSRIAFSSDRNGYAEIFVMDADGANAVRLVVSGFEPAWSPDGEWLAYATDFGLEVYDLGSGVPYTVTFDASDRSPRWFTDYGFRLAFARTVDAGGSPESDLFEVDVSALFSPLESPFVAQPGDDLEPAFVEGEYGSMLAYASQQGDALGEVGIRTEGPFGPDGASPGHNPSWSPDGVFVVYDDAGSLRVFEPGSGTASVAVTDTPLGSGGNDSNPDWRPVPEPGMGLLSSAGLATLLALRARRARSASRRRSRR